MLVRFMPELGKYAMNSLTVMLLFLLVFVSTVTKDILEAKKLLKRYEAFWIYPFLSVVLLIGFALNTDITLNLFIMLELAACVNLWILEYRRYKKQEMVWNLVLFIYLYCRIIQLSLKIL